MLTLQLDYGIGAVSADSIEALKQLTPPVCGVGDSLAQRMDTVPVTSTSVWSGGKKPTESSGWKVISA